MRRSRTNLISIAAGASTLILLMTGAAVTSSQGQPRQASLLIVHAAVAVVVTLLVIGLVIALSRVARLNRFGWIVLLALLGEIALGYVPNPVAATIHAILSAFLLAAVSLIWLMTSPSWQRDPEFVQDYGWPSLRSLSAFASILVAVQVGFGASLRHGAIGVMPHLLGALVVALFIVIVGVFATNQFPKHATLRPMAVTLLIITGVQVFFGMTVFLMRMMNISATKAWLAMSVAHVATGNLTFAASAMLAIEIRRNVRPAAGPS
jgi:hypothetical protein